MKRDTTSINAEHARSMFLLMQSPVANVGEQIVIAPHHPDRLRRPAARPGTLESERFQQALAWNVFRTLELLPPAFWLRRLHARLGGDGFPAAPQIVRVGLWQPLGLPPAHSIDGASADVVVDVVVETEHAVWALMICGSDGIRCLESDAAGRDAMGRLVDAGSWHAGTRPCYVGIIQPATAEFAGATLVRRYSRSRDSARIRSGSRDSALGNFQGVGVVRWTDLAAILSDCEQAHVLSTIERALARNAVTWLASLGIG